MWVKKRAAHGVGLQFLYSTIRFPHHFYRLSRDMPLIFYIWDQSSKILSFKPQWDSSPGPPDPDLETLSREPRLRWSDHSSYEASLFFSPLKHEHSFPLVAMGKRPLSRYGEALVRLRRGLRSGETGGEERIPPCSGHLASPRDSGSTVVEEI